MPEVPDNFANSWYNFTNFEFDNLLRRT